MIARYLVVAARIRQELAALENVYAFDFVLEHITPLVQRLRPCFTRVQNELEGFADWLEQLAQADND